MGLAATIYTVDPAERRSRERRPVGSESTVRSTQKGAANVIVHNLSEQGCAIESDLALELGSTISIGLSGRGACQAKVLRKDGNIYGCEFLSAIDAEDARLAFTRDTVVRHSFAGQVAAGQLAAELPVAKWHPAARVSFIAGTSAALWLMLITGANRLIG